MANRLTALATLRFPFPIEQLAASTRADARQSIQDEAMGCARHADQVGLHAGKNIGKTRRKPRASAASSSDADPDDHCARMIAWVPWAVQVACLIQLGTSTQMIINATNSVK